MADMPLHIEPPVENTSIKFTPYQKFVVGVLAFLQFTIILDFMILSPLGAILMPALKITPTEFGTVVSVYAFSAGASGLLAGGFADKFDRKKILLFFYAGFLIGTVMCGLARSYEALLIARMITGLFGGVIGSIVFAITTDLFPMNMRGRVMGVIQTAFSGSQVLGIPFGLLIANHLDWHWTFFLIVLVGLIAGIFIAIYLKPIDEHLKLQKDSRALKHLLSTLTNWRYLKGFGCVALISIGGFMIMPFSSAFTVHNIGISLDDLPMVFMLTGVISMFSGPYVGKLTDKYGKLPLFVIGTLIACVMISIYTRLSITPILFVIAINAIMHIGFQARMISSQALMSAIPEPANRGAFMSVSSSLQQISGGIASVVAGFIVSADDSGRIQQFDILADIVVIASLLTIVMMWRIQKMVAHNERAMNQ